jgi:hypothetical protein
MELLWKPLAMSSHNGVPGTGTKGTGEQCTHIDEMGYGKKDGL